ncbi:MAG TPA: nicotinate phosphoribosyltransferase [Dehalococcoidia bacterium]|nr:nicotinate phosphoribosyltransferase [Dehalococcoidia bacterium]
MASAVLVIDMLRGFAEEGNPLYCGPPARHIIPNIQKLLERELAGGARAFFICDRHTLNDPEFQMFPPHCIEGTPEAEVIPELAGYPGETIPKQRYSGFFGTDLDARLEALKPEKLIVCGVCTDICVMHTVADARNRGYQVEVPADAVASFDPKAHRFALEHMEKVLGARLTTVAEEAKPRFVVEPSIIRGDTSDIYFLRTVEILKKEGINPVATMEIFPSRDGILCGIEEVKALLKEVLPQGSQVWALDEGEAFHKKEVVLRITAPYQSYGIYETPMLGILAQSSGWATAARECAEAARGIPVICFGARHVHALVAGRMEYAAFVGGATGCACVEGARLAGVEPMGTMPHALVICLGDTTKAILAFDKHMPPEVPRIALVDTFLDEPQESIIVAQAMGGRLQGVRLDTPPERGGVTPDLVKETRARLDQAGFRDVSIFVSGGVTAERIRQYVEEGAPVDGFGVGSYISGARPIDFTADLHEVEGKAIAKRGRIPGITPSPRLKRVM